MLKVFRGEKPTTRGVYLFIWGWVYVAVSTVAFIRGVSSTPWITVYFFAIAGVIALLASLFHKLDSIAFAGLVGASALESLLYVFDITTVGFPLTISRFAVFFGLASSHFVVARWPSGFDTIQLPPRMTKKRE